MPAASLLTLQPQHEERVVALVWRSAVVLTLVIQVFIGALRTPWGKQSVPNLLVRAGFLRATQKEQLVTFLYPPGLARVPSLEQQIKERLPASEPIEVVYYDPLLATSVEDLRYQLYPRVLTERLGTRGDTAEAGCRIDWRPDRDIRIACAGSNGGSFSSLPVTARQP